MDLCNIGEIRRLLDKYGLAPKKGYGQNFLTNRAIPARIAESSAYGNNTYTETDGERVDICAFEVGPGIGCLTKELSSRFKKVTAVEIDTGLIPLLAESLEECDNVNIVNTDFMKLDLNEFIKEQFGDTPVHVCANLPYYITTPVLMRFLEYAPGAGKSQIRKITTMIQLEVADRICAKAGSSEYGAITAAVNLHGSVKKLFTVSAGNFLPAPKVDSAVIEITLYENGVRDVYDGFPSDPAECDKMLAGVKEIINLAFGQRRKTLTNALSKKYPKSVVSEALESVGLSADVRGEKLSAEDFCKLYDAIKSIN